MKDGHRSGNQEYLDVPVHPEVDQIPKLALRRRHRDLNVRRATLLDEACLANVQGTRVNGVSRGASCVARETISVPISIQAGDVAADEGDRTSDNGRHVSAAARDVKIGLGGRRKRALQCVPSRRSSTDLSSGRRRFNDYHPPGALRR
jgi:hypothetical protein